MIRLLAAEIAEAVDAAVQFDAAQVLEARHPLEHLHHDVRARRIRESAEIRLEVIARCLWRSRGRAPAG